MQGVEEIRVRHQGNETRGSFSFTEQAVNKRMAQDGSAEGGRVKNGTKRGLCCEPSCRNLRRKDRHRCFTCDSRRRRKANPARAAYRGLKDHATARGIPFSLSFP